MDESRYPHGMSVHLQIRDLPDELHQTLRWRAAARGLSLRRYALEVLQEHCRQPSMDEWLAGLSRLTPVVLESGSRGRPRGSRGGRRRIDRCSRAGFRLSQRAPLLTHHLPRRLDESRGSGRGDAQDLGEPGWLQGGDLVRGRDPVFGQTPGEGFADP